MTEFERQLRDALDLLSDVPVAGREERVKMCKAEAKIMALANTFATMEKEGRLHISTKKEEQPHDEAGNEQRNV